LCGWLSLSPSAKVHLFILSEVSFVHGCNCALCHDWQCTVHVWSYMYPLSLPVIVSSWLCGLH
jgi:hypothetical protein